MLLVSQTVMGIRTGRSHLFSYLGSGLWYANGKYKISVDGELMRYKGMYAANLLHPFPEQSIAEKSALYVKNVCDRLIADKMNGVQPQSIDVYMDGSRVRNKVKRVINTTIDHALVRENFSKECRTIGMHVHCLDMGEAELEMYLRRDQSMVLNIFLTYDSDILSILYGHEPLVVDRRTNIIATTYNDSGHYDVRDSCLLAYPSSGHEIKYIGFDFSASSNRLSVIAFRTLVALCGTDFTAPMLTETMIEGIVKAKDEFQFINDLDNEYHEIAASFLFIGIRSSGYVKRATTPTTINEYSLEKFITVCRLYCTYIETGNMNGVMDNIDMAQASQNLLWAMQNVCENCYQKPLPPLKSFLLKWTSELDLESAIRQLRDAPLHKCKKKRRAIISIYDRMMKYKQFIACKDVTL